MKQRGVTMVEILVTIVVLTIGALGAVGLQATVLADTQNASLRGLVALQGASLVNRMHANRAFWAVASATLAFGVNGAVVTSNGGLPITADRDTCTTTPAPAGPVCTPAKMAAVDLKDWAAEASAWLPGLSVDGSCSMATQGPAGSECKLILRWTEHHVSKPAAKDVDGTATAGERSYTLYVRP